MASECHFQRDLIRVSFYSYVHEDPVQEMTIGHPPQHEERTLKILIYPRDLTLVT